MRQNNNGGALKSQLFTLRLENSKYRGGKGVKKKKTSPPDTGFFLVKKVQVGERNRRTWARGSGIRKAPS